MTNQEKIQAWDNLPDQEKAAMGNMYITHDTNLKVWCKPFTELSLLKQKRVLQSIERFASIKHPLIGFGI